MFLRNVAIGELTASCVVVVVSTFIITYIISVITPIIISRAPFSKRVSTIK